MLARIFDAEGSCRETRKFPCSKVGFYKPAEFGVRRRVMEGASPILAFLASAIREGAFYQRMGALSSRVLAKPLDGTGAKKK